METTQITPIQAKAILALLDEAKELDYITETGDLELFSNTYPKSEIEDLELKMTHIAKLYTLAQNIVELLRGYKSQDDNEQFQISYSDRAFSFGCLVDYNVSLMVTSNPSAEDILWHLKRMILPENFCIYTCPDNALVEIDSMVDVGDEEPSYVSDDEYEFPIYVD